MANKVFSSAASRRQTVMQQHASEVKVCRLLSGVKQVVAASPTAKRNAAARAEIEFLKDLKRYD